MHASPESTESQAWAVRKSLPSLRRQPWSDRLLVASSMSPA